MNIFDINERKNNKSRETKLSLRPKNVVPGTSPENCNGGGLIDLVVSVVEDTGVRRLDSPSPFTL